MMGRKTGFAGTVLAGLVAMSQGAPAQERLIWMHQSGDWGAWAAYAVPESDHVIFSIGCIESPAGVSLHVELPVFDRQEGEPAWIELSRDELTTRFDGFIFFNEMLSEHQVIGSAPRSSETFDSLARFLSAPGSFTASVPDASETLPVDEAAAEALAAVRGVCLDE